MYRLASEIAGASARAASATLWLSVSSGASSPHAVKAIALLMPKTKRENKRFSPIPCRLCRLVSWSYLSSYPERLIEYLPRFLTQESRGLFCDDDSRKVLSVHPGWMDTVSWERMIPGGECLTRHSFSNGGCAKKIPATIARDWDFFLSGGGGRLQARLRSARSGCPLP